MVSEAINSMRPIELRVRLADGRFWQAIENACLAGESFEGVLTSLRRGQSSSSMCVAPRTTSRRRSGRTALTVLSVEFLPP